MKFLTQCVAAIATAVSLSAMSPALAQDKNKFPSQMIRIIVPFSAGGSVDVYARPLAHELTEALGIPVIVDNRPGAAGIVGTQFVKAAPADGYTLLMSTSSFVGSAVFNASLARYDPMRDFTPVAGFTNKSGFVLVAKKELPVKSVPELVALAKGQPGKLTYAHSGIGNGTHIALELFKQYAGVDILGVPFKGVSMSMTELIAGRVDMMMTGISFARPFIQEQRVKALGVTGSERSALVPDAPTMAEAGYKDFVFRGYIGVWSNSDVPKPIVDRLYEIIAKASATPRMTQVLQDGGLSSRPEASAEFAEFIEADLKQHQEVGQRLKLISK